MIEARRAAVTFVLLVAAVACRSPAPAPDRAGDAGSASSIAEPLSRGAECGIAGPACEADQYCAYEPRLCGKGKRAGACRARPARCGDPYAPVCGCDRKVYDNECQAHAAGVDLDVTGACRQQIPDWIACGPSYCNARESYCEIVLSDVFELPTDYTCKPLPSACKPEGGVARGCDCFPAGTRCLSFCGPIESGGLAGFHLTCRL